MYTSVDIYFNVIQVINGVIKRRENRIEQPWSNSLAEEIAAALSNDNLLRNQ